MAKLEITITEIGPRTYGFNGQNRGTLIQLSGHPHIEGREVARFGDRYREICGTCQGTGFRPEYAGILGGQCFYCRASGLGELVGTGTALELARKLRTRAQAADRRAAKRLAKVEQAITDHRIWLAAHPEIREIAERFGHLDNCEHGGDCQHDTCWTRRQANRKNHSPLLLELASYATCRIITDKQVELLVQLVADHAERVIAREAEAAWVAEQQWIGTEGAKIIVTGVLGKPVHLEGDYGTRTIYKLTTATGDRVAWFRTGHHEFEAGETITLTGIVKKLTESEKYGKETQLTRCKIS